MMNILNSMVVFVILLLWVVFNIVQFTQQRADEYYDFETGASITWPCIQ